MKNFITVGLLIAALSALGQSDCGGLKREEFMSVLVGNILPYWINNMQDTAQGGFYGRIDSEEKVHEKANKGAVLNARILWTFSSAYRISGNPEYLSMADRAYRYFVDWFIDKTYGGVYWDVDFEGNPVTVEKQTYAQGFALYGFSEYFRATGKKEALEMAIKMFEVIEKHCFDSISGGYFEAFSRDWSKPSEKDVLGGPEGYRKSMNTHLHILEPYTNLYRVWKDPGLAAAQKSLINTFIKDILNNETGHLKMYFSDNWTSLTEDVSYGHDIEASWLLFEAAEVLGDEELKEKIKDISLRIVDASLEGFQPDGSMIYESGRDFTNDERSWWVQAETIVGLMYAYRNSNDEKYARKAEMCLKYLKDNIIDNENGEWFSRADGKNKGDKASMWKCPYHNSRMCIEIMHLCDTDLP